MTGGVLRELLTGEAMGIQYFGLGVLVGSLLLGVAHIVLAFLPPPKRGRERRS